jgi:hypothetical protein
MLALVTATSLIYVKRTQAFTLIELDNLPAVQLVANQSIIINITNTSTEGVDYVVDVYGGDGGLLLTRNMTLDGGNTWALTYKNQGTAPLTIRAVIGAGTANATITDGGVVDPTNGELVVIARGGQSQATTSLLLPAVQLVSNQTAMVNICNVATESVSGTLDIYTGEGTLLLSKPLTIAPGQTFSLPYKHPAGGPGNIRAEISFPNTGTVTADMATFDVNTGQMVALLPAVQ